MLSLVLQLMGAPSRGYAALGFWAIASCATGFTWYDIAKSPESAEVLSWVTGELTPKNCKGSYRFVDHCDLKAALLAIGICLTIP